MYRKHLKNEFYTRKAKEEGYPARSVYKLMEMDAEYALLDKGNTVLDLGCAPGSWALYVLKKIGSSGRLVGIDIAPLNIKAPQNLIFIGQDMLNVPIDALKEYGPYDVVLSDAAPSTSGIKHDDAAQSLLLAEKAWEIARHVLRENGYFVCKILEGENTQKFITEIKERFALTKRFKPKASRKESKEFYIVAKKFIPDKDPFRNIGLTKQFAKP